MDSVSTQTKSLDTIPVRKGSRSRDPADILVFLIPCLQLIQIRVVGVLNGSDLLLLAVFFYLVFREKVRIATPTGKWFVVLCSLWLVSQCVTDVVRHTAFADYFARVERYWDHAHQFCGALHADVWTAATVSALRVGVSCRERAYVPYQSQ